MDFQVPCKQGGLVDVNNKPIKVNHILKGNESYYLVIELKRIEYRDFIVTKVGSQNIEGVKNTISGKLYWNQKNIINEELKISND